MSIVTNNVCMLSFNLMWRDYHTGKLCTLCSGYNHCTQGGFTKYIHVAVGQKALHGVLVLQSTRLKVWLHTLLVHDLSLG